MAEENVDTLTSGNVRFQGGPEVPACADLSGVSRMTRSRPRHFTKAAVEFVGFIAGQGKLGQAAYASQIEDTRMVTMRGTTGTCW